MVIIVYNVKSITKIYYRPIALATVLLLKCAEYLSTSDNQFGLKSCHSTDLCIYTLKEFIDYYKTRGTTVYVTFLDASKAFDRIDHWLLFDKMIKKGVPLFIIKLLVFWYSRQRMFVRLGDTCVATDIHVRPLSSTHTTINPIQRLGS